MSKEESSLNAMPRQQPGQWGQMLGVAGRALDRLFALLALHPCAETPTRRVRG